MFYKFPQNSEAGRRYKHHEQVLPRIIGDTNARNVASTYIYRAPFKDKMVITKMLNEWNQRGLDTTKETAEVIRPKAATVIKDWLINAKDHEAHVAEKFLTHLKEGKEMKRVTKSATFRRVFQRESPRCVAEQQQKDTPRGVRCEHDIDKIAKKKRPHTSKPLTYGTYYPQVGQGNNTGVFNIVPQTPNHQIPNTEDKDIRRDVKCEHDIDRITKKRKEWRPHTSKPLTYGTFYPNSGRGNNTGVFNIVPNSQRSRPCSPQPPPSPPPEQASTSPRQCSAPAQRQGTIRYCPPSVNRSCLFEAVREPSEYPYIQYSQPRIENIQNTANSRPSSKLKFSANMQAEGTRMGQKENVIETKNIVENEDLAVANMQVDGIGNVLETENITMAENNGGRHDVWGKEEVREEQNVNEEVNVASKQSSARIQKHSCESYQYFPPSPQSPVEQLNYFSVLPMGGYYNTHARPMPGLGTDDRRAGPGRRYDKHFTLG